MTTAEKYRQYENSPLIQTARYIFNIHLKDSAKVKLGELIDDIKTGKTPSKQEKRYYEDQFIDWYKPDEIGKSKVLERSVEKLSKYAYDSNQATIYTPNTLLINAIGDVGRVSILMHEASSNQQITGIKVNESKILTEYCYFFLVANRSLFYKDLFQTTLPIVNQKKIQQFLINVPAVNVQKSTVSFFRALENLSLPTDIDHINADEELKCIAKKFFLIDRKNRILATELAHQLDLVKQLRQAFLREAMQGKLVPQVASDEPASLLLQKIKAEKAQLIKEGKLKKEKELPPIKPEEIPFEIPKNWVWCRLASISLNRDEGRIPISQAERERRKKVFDYYGASGVIDKIDHYTHDGSYLLIGEDGANLRAKSTPIAFIAKGKFWVNNHAHVLEFLNEVTLRFMEYCMNAIDINPFITGGFQPKLSQGNLNVIPIPLPPLSEQHRIVAKLEQLMRHCDELEQSIKLSQTQNEQLLQQVLREALSPKGKEYKIKDEMSLAAEE